MNTKKSLYKSKGIILTKISLKLTFYLSLLSSNHEKNTLQLAESQIIFDVEGINHG